MFLDRHIIEFQQYLKTMDYSEETLKSYRSHLKDFMRYLENSEITQLTQIDRNCIFNYQMSMMTQPKKLVISTHRHRLIAVKTFFKYLVKVNELLYDPTSGLELPKENQALPRRILSIKEIKKLLNQPDTDTILGLRDKAILELFYSTGIRNQEARDLVINDVDTQEQMIRIRHGKGDQDRVVPLGGIASGYVEEYLRYARQKLLHGKENGYLFVTMNGNRMDKEDINRLIAKYSQKADLKKHITAHSLRHTCATHLLRNKASIRHIQELLGHRSMESTQIYTHVDLSDLKKAHKKYHPRERS